VQERERENTVVGTAKYSKPSLIWINEAKIALKDKKETLENK
jgi:hypothetical protein